MIILHGDDETKSRQRLTQLIATSQASEIIRTEAKDLDLTTLNQQTNSLGFFTTSRLIVIYNPFSIPNTKILDFLKDHQNDDFILWQDKTINAGSLRSFSQAKIESFKLNPLVFNFVESLRPNNQTQLINLFRQYLDKDESLEFLFAMLVRQIRMLLSPLDTVPPWQRTRLEKQAKSFSRSQLISLHHQLYNIDKAIKTGTTPLNLSDLILELLLSM